MYWSFIKPIILFDGVIKARCCTDERCTWRHASGREQLKPGYSSRSWRDHLYRRRVRLGIRIELHSEQHYMRRS